MGPGRDGDLTELFAPGTVLVEVSLGRQRVKPHGTEETECGLIPPAVAIGPGRRECGVPVDTDAGLAEPGLDGQGCSFDAGDASRPPHDLAARIGGIETELGAESKKMRSDSGEHSLHGSRIREQTVDFMAPEARILGGQTDGLRFQFPGACFGKPAEGRVTHSGDHRSPTQLPTFGIRRFAMISRITSLVPAPMPQFCTPREQRAT